MVSGAVGSFLKMVSGPMGSFLKMVSALKAHLFRRSQDLWAHLAPLQAGLSEFRERLIAQVQKRLEINHVVKPNFSKHDKRSLELLREWQMIAVPNDKNSRFTLVDQATHGEFCQDIARQAMYEWIPDVGASYSSWLHMYDTLFSGVIIYKSHASKKKQYGATP